MANISTNEDIPLFIRKPTATTRNIRFSAAEFSSQPVAQRNTVMNQQEGW